MSSPVRKILAAAQTQKRVVSDVSAMASATCQTGGAGRSAIRISIKNGLAGGNSDKPTESALDGFRKTAIQTNAGNIDSSMIGIISDLGVFDLVAGCSYRHVERPE